MLTWHAQNPGFISSVAEGKEGEGRGQGKERGRDRVKGRGRTKKKRKGGSPLSGSSDRSAKDTSALSQITAEATACSQAWRAVSW